MSKHSKTEKKEAVVLVPWHQLPSGPWQVLGPMLNTQDHLSAASVCSAFSYQLKHPRTWCPTVMCAEQYLVRSNLLPPKYPSIALQFARELQLKLRHLSIISLLQDIPTCPNVTRLELHYTLPKFNKDFGAKFPALTALECINAKLHIAWGQCTFFWAEFPNNITTFKWAMDGLAAAEAGRAYALRTFIQTGMPFLKHLELAHGSCLFVMAQQIEVDIPTLETLILRNHNDGMYGYNTTEIIGNRFPKLRKLTIANCSFTLAATMSLVESRNHASLEHLELLDVHTESKQTGCSHGNVCACLYAMQAGGYIGYKKLHTLDVSGSTHPSCWLGLVRPCNFPALKTLIARRWTDLFNAALFQDACARIRREFGSDFTIIHDF